MEELRKLERVQRMLCFMETLGLSTNDRDSDRFVADFLLFMIQPCGALDIQKRHHLIFEHLQKISPSKLEAVLHSVTEEVEELEAHQNVDNHRIYPEYSTQYDLESTPYSQILKIQSEDEAVIQFSALQRANSTLEDFCRSYFMFHGMDASKAHSIFIFLPVLYFTESYIYHLDNLNEKQMLQSAQDNSVNPVNKFSRSDPFDPLIQLLQQQGLMTERIRAEFKLGIEYWKLEQKLCDELTKNKDVILIEDVMRAIHLKSFDYRVLNLLLYQLRGQVVNELHMEFLSVSEFLVEVSDDLYDYEEDVVDNTFNILRMFVGIYGPSKAPTMLAKCITEAEEKYERLSRALDPELSLNYWRRCEEAIREGCPSTAAHVVGKWNMPSIIVNEESFRLQANVKNRRASTS